MAKIEDALDEIEKFMSDKNVGKILHNEDVLELTEIVERECGNNYSQNNSSKNESAESFFYSKQVSTIIKEEIKNWLNQNLAQIVREEVREVITEIAKNKK